LKPSGSGIKEALKILGTKSDGSAMIGDTPMDVLAAHDAKVHSLALIDGVGKIKDLEQTWPDYMLISLKEAAELLKRLWLQ
jgi:Predicted sugar phosphatases of the HAD superfamily